MGCVRESSPPSPTVRGWRFRTVVAGCCVAAQNDANSEAWKKLDLISPCTLRLVCSSYLYSPSTPSQVRICHEARSDTPYDLVSTPLPTVRPVVLLSR